MAHKIYKLKNGVSVPSTTTLIGNNLGWNKDFLIDWSIKKTLEGLNPKKITEESSDIGTLSHFLVELSLKKLPFDPTLYNKRHLLKARNAYFGFRAWWLKTNPILKHSELELVSEKYHFGGTVDLVVVIDNMIYIIDLKTSNYIHSEMIIQVAAYKKLYEENFNESVDTGMILQLAKDKTHYNEFNITNEHFEHGWNAFLHLINIEKEHKFLGV